MASSDRRFRYRGYRVEKAQAGWDIWLGRDRIDWAPTKFGQRSRWTSCWCEASGTAKVSTDTAKKAGREFGATAFGD